MHHRARHGSLNRGLVQKPVFYFATAKAQEDTRNVFTRMPELMKIEVLECLSLLEIKPEKTAQSINVKAIKKQYLELAQRYHPDVLAAQAEFDEEKILKLQDKFVKIKEAFDRLIELNSEYDNQLLADPEEDLA